MSTPWLPSNRSSSRQDDQGLLADRPDDGRLSPERSDSAATARSSALYALWIAANPYSIIESATH